jgi:hypothetical protein
MPLLLPGLLSQRQKWMSTQTHRLSAPRWCMLAGQSVGIALAQCCDRPVLWQRRPSIGTV